GDAAGEAANGIHLLRLAQAALELFAAGDVFGNDFGDAAGVLGAADAASTQPYVNKSPIFALPCDFQVFNSIGGEKCLAYAVALRRLGVDIGPRIQGQHLFPGFVAQHGDHGAVHFEITAISGAIDAVDRALKKIAIASLRMAKLLFRHGLAPQGIFYDSQFLVTASQPPLITACIPPQRKCQENGTEGLKPQHLIKVRTQTKNKSGSRGIPYSVIVGGDDAKGIASGRDLAVISGTPIAGVDPIPVIALELVFELYLLRRQEAEPGVMKFEIASSRRNVGHQVRTERMMINRHCLDVHRRRQRIDREVLRAGDRQTFHHSKPDAPIMVLAGGGLKTCSRYGAAEAVLGAICYGRERMDFSFREVIELLFGKPKNPLVAAHP